MRKFIASAGLLTVGAANMQAAYAPGLSPLETSKPWSISAALRGFYDDNYLNAPSQDRKGSAGFEVSPSIRLNLPMEQTYLGLSYLYSMKYYFDRPDHNIDHLHEFTLKFDHRFTERYKLTFDDSFVYSVEPDIVDSSGAVTQFQRQNSEVLRNRATVGLEVQLTELLGLGASYQNTWYDYLKNEVLEADLNRVEHLFDIHGAYQLQEHTRALFGYHFGMFDYTSSKLLNPGAGAYDPITNPTGSLTGNSRDNRSHYFYVGGEHAFSSQLNGTAQVGAEYTSYDHLSESAWNPYVDIRGTYTYLPGSYVQFGISHARSATDVVGTGAPDDIVRDAEATTLFASINHRITPKVTGSLLLQGQRSAFSGGTLDGEIDYYFVVGANIGYRLNPNWSAELGYNFDRLDSDLSNRSFSRNRVYGGVRADF